MAVAGYGFFPGGAAVKDRYDEFLAQYSLSQPALQRFIAAHLPDPHEVEDVLQEVAICLWKNFDDYAPGTSFLKWAIRAAQFKVLHARRARARRRWVLTPALADRAADYYAGLDFETAEARRRALDRCIERLSPPQRELLLARYRRDLSCARIARESGRTENHVRILLFRIRAALRKCVGRFLGPAAVAGESAP